jgi:hypothetical protein
MALDLQTLLVTAKVQARISTHKKALSARVEQRYTAEQLADQAARQQARRDSIERALSSESLDAMRFRWLGEHSTEASKLAGMSLSEMRAEIDLLIKRQATLRLTEMRNHHAELTGRRLPEADFERA